MKFGFSFRRIALRAAAALSLAIVLPFAAACDKTSDAPLTAYVPNDAGMMVYVNTDKVMAHELFQAFHGTPPFVEGNKLLESSGFTLDDFKGKIVASVAETFEPDGSHGRFHYRVVFQTAIPHAEELLRRVHDFLVKQYADDKTSVIEEPVAGKPALSIRERGQECLIVAASMNQLQLCTPHGEKPSLFSPSANAKNTSFAASVTPDSLAVIRLDSSFISSLNLDQVLYAGQWDGKSAAAKLRERITQLLVTLSDEGENLALSVRMNFASADAAQREDGRFRLLMMEMLNRAVLLGITVEAVSIERRDNTLSMNGKISVDQLHEQLNRIFSHRKKSEACNGDFQIDSTEQGRSMREKGQP